MYNRYGSSDFYHILVAIDARVTALPCRGNHIDGGAAYKDLTELIRKEREACAIRVAKAKAERMRKDRGKA